VGDNLARVRAVIKAADPEGDAIDEEALIEEAVRLSMAKKSR